MNGGLAFVNFGLTLQVKARRDLGQRPAETTKNIAGSPRAANPYCPEPKEETLRGRRQVDIPALAWQNSPFKGAGLPANGRALEGLRDPAGLLKHPLSQQR